MATANRGPRETERVLQLYEKEARKYDREMRFFDRLLFAGARKWVCSQAEGDVLEIGIGTGRNLPHYRDDVRLTGIELSPAMLEIARARARELGRQVDLRVGDAQALEFADDSFDTVVCTLSLCTIPDDRAAVAQVRRVLRPGGRFLLVSFYAAMVAAGLIVEFVFDGLGLIPSERKAKVIEASVTLNYTTVLNIVFLALAALLLWRYFARGGGLRMLRMMNAPMAHEHAHEHGHG